MVEKINEADLEIQSNIRQKYYRQPLFVDCTPYEEERIRPRLNDAQLLTLEIILIGRQHVWLPRCSIAAEKRKASHGDSRQHFSRGITTPRTQSNRINSSGAGATQVTVEVHPFQSPKHFDPFRCECGRGSVTHHLIKSCDNAGLLKSRAFSLACDNLISQTRIAPFTLDDSPRLWTG